MKADAARRSRTLAILSRLRELAPGLSRLLVFAIVASSMTVYATGRLMRSHVDRALLDAGHGLLAMAGSAPEVEASTGPRTLILNGRRLTFRVGVSERDPAALMSEQRRACSDLGRQGDEPGIAEGDYGGRHYLGCVAIPSGPQVDSAESREEPRGPRFRFVYAERGHSAASRYFELWTDEPVALATLFGDGGDAPGRDVPGIGRPPESRRLLSAREEGHGEELAVYESRRPSAHLVDFYKTLFRADGREVVSSSEGDAIAVVGAARDSLVTVVIAPSEGGHTVTAIASP